MIEEFNGLLFLMFEEFDGSVGDCVYIKSTAIFRIKLTRNVIVIESLLDFLKMAT